MTKHSDTALQQLEASILGAVLLRPETLSELPRLEVDDFSDLRHRAVFAAMRNLEAVGTPIDSVTLEAEVARRAGHSDSVDYSFLVVLSMSVPTAANALEYAKQVREASLSRKVRIALADVLVKADRDAMTGGEVLSAALAVLSNIDEDQPDTAKPIFELVRGRLRQYEEIANSGSAMTGYPTGVQALDTFTGGVQPGIVTIVAARPGMGKSSFGLSIADASSKSVGVHLFSLEDTEEAYADRTLSRGSSVPAEDLRAANLKQGQLSEIAKAMAGLRGRRWLVDSRSGITADEIVRSVRRHRRGNDTKVVIVDYVQLVKRPPRISPHEALTEIVTVLADAAKQDRMAYVVMSQLNREIEKRTDKRPQLADLRESGSLEERSKCVIGMYRGHYYGTKPQKGVDYDDNWKDGHTHPPEGPEFAAHMQLCVLKNSNGRTGVVWATWSGPTTCVS